MTLSKTNISIAILVILAGAGFFYSGKKSTEPLFKEAPLFTDVPKFAEPSKSPVHAPAINLLDHVGAEPKQIQPAILTPPSQVVSSYTPKIKSVARSLALSEAAKGNWYSSIVAEVEGFRNRAYYDNKGAAIGMGWNLGQQSTARNTELTRAIGMDSAPAAQLVALSGVQQPSSLPSASITPEQGSQAVMLMREQYEAPMRKLVPSFANLARNQQDALVYHAYKVGGGGAARYTTMLSALKIYSADPTEANKLKVADTFTYKYTLNGKEYTDSRSKLYLAALFTSPESYQYLLGTTAAPADFNKVAKLASQKIDTSKPAEAQVVDDFGDVKEELMRTGMPFNLLINEVDLIKKLVPGGVPGLL